MKCGGTKTTHARERWITTSSGCVKNSSENRRGPYIFRPYMVPATSFCLRTFLNSVEKMAKPFDQVKGRKVYMRFAGDVLDGEGNCAVTVGDTNQRPGSVLTRSTTPPNEKQRLT